MPLGKDPLGESRENPAYCSYCFSGGKLHADQASSLAEFQSACFRSMRERGVPWILARLFAFSIRFSPYWKNRRVR